MKSAISFFVFFLVLLLHLKVSAQEMESPWTIFTTDLGETTTVYSTKDCYIRWDQRKKFLTVHTKIRYLPYDPQSYITEMVGISLAGPEPKLIAQASWYDVNSFLGMKRMERGKYYFDENQEKVYGRQQTYLFMKKLRKEYELLPEEVKLMIPAIKKGRK